MRLLFLPLAATGAALLLPFLAPAATPGKRAEAGSSGATPPACPVLCDPLGGQLIATCEVEGQPVRMIVDTGASHTTLDEAFARRALPHLPVSNVQLSGRTNVKRALKLMKGRFRADRIFVREHPLFLVDLSEANGMLKTDIQGVLGINTMSRMPFVWNATDVVYRCAPGLKKSCLMKKLHGTTDETGRLVIQAKAGGKTLPLLLDTGSSITLLPESWWEAQGAEPLRFDAADVNGREEQQAKRGNPMDLEIGEGLVLKNVRPILSPGGKEGQLGLDALRQIELYYLPEHGGNGSSSGSYYGRALDTPQEP